MTNQTILSAIESELVRVESYVADLRQKVRAALNQIETPPRGATPAAPEAPTLPVYLTTKGVFHPRGFWYRGTFQRCAAYIDIYVELLRAIAKDEPESLTRTAAELHRYGRTRTYLATSREVLFRNQTEQWARAHSRRIVEGWFADSNLGLDTMKKLTRRILRVNGLQEGVERRDPWDRTPAQPASPQQSLSSATRARH